MFYILRSNCNNVNTFGKAKNIHYFFSYSFIKFNELRSHNKVS